MRAMMIAGLIALAAGPAALAQGLLVVTDGVPQSGDLRSCMVGARRALSGTGMVIQVAGGSVYGSNEERTVTIRCDLPGTIVFVEGFFPGDKDWLDPIKAAFIGAARAPLIPSVSKSHQYTVDCTRQTSCQIDPAAICKQAYAASAKPGFKILNKSDCADRQGSYTCSVDYELNCT